MLIFTGTANSAALPSQGLATPPLPVAGQLIEFRVSAEAAPDEVEALDARPHPEEKAIEAGKKAISALGPEAEFAVGAVELWQYSEALVDVFGDSKSPWSKRLDAVVDAAGGTKTLLTLIAPGLESSPVFHLLDHGLTIVEEGRKIHKAMTEKPRPLLGCRIEPGMFAPRR